MWKTEPSEHDRTESAHPGSTASHTHCGTRASCTLLRERGLEDPYTWSRWGASAGLWPSAFDTPAFFSGFQHHSWQSTAKRIVQESNGAWADMARQGTWWMGVPIISPFLGSRVLKDRGLPSLFFPLLLSSLPSSFPFFFSLTSPFPLFPFLASVFSSFLSSLPAFLLSFWDSN